MAYEDVNRMREVSFGDRKGISSRIRPEKFPKWLSDYQIFKKTLLCLFSDDSGKQCNAASLDVGQRDMTAASRQLNHKPHSSVQLLQRLTTRQD